MCYVDTLRNCVFGSLERVAAVTGDDDHCVLCSSIASADVGEADDVADNVALDISGFWLTGFISGFTSSFPSFGFRDARITCR